MRAAEHTNPSVLLIGSDRQLFEPESTVRARHRAYARELGGLDCIVVNTGHREKAADGTLRLFPTNSWMRALYGVGIVRAAFSLPKPDVVTVQDPFELGLAAFLVARLRGAALHVQVHTDFGAPGFAAGLHQKARAQLAWFVLRRASRIRVVSETIRARLVEKGVRAPITVLPIFVNVARFAALPRLKHPRFKIALLCVGRLEPEKRFDLAIRALAEARAAGHDAGLTIVGAGREAYALKQLVRELKLEQFVVFAGWQTDIAPYLSEADAVLVPSVFEGYGMIIVEALAAGVPVIATDVGIAREAGAMIAQASFPQALVEWIEHGPRQATLALGGPETLDEYVRAWCADVNVAASRINAAKQV